MNDPRFTFPEIATRILERRRCALQQHFSRDVLESMNVEVAEGMLTSIFDQMLMRLRIDLYGEKVATAEQTHEVQYPISAWEMFKRDHMPEWFKQRYPVRYATVVVKFTADSWRMYPNAEIPLSGSQYGTHVRVTDYRKSVQWPGMNDEP